MQKHRNEDQLRPSVGWAGDRIEIIEQTKLPGEFTLLVLASVDDVVDAIYRLAVRGAPAIGACGALGMVVGLDERRPRESSSARTALAELITAIITEVGVLRPPYESSIRAAFTAGGDQ